MAKQFFYASSVLVYFEWEGIFTNQCMIMYRGMIWLNTGKKDNSLVVFSLPCRHVYTHVCLHGRANQWMVVFTFQYMPHKWSNWLHITKLLNFLSPKCNITIDTYMLVCMDACMHMRTYKVVVTLNYVSILQLQNSNFKVQGHSELH